MAEIWPQIILVSFLICLCIAASVGLGLQMRSASPDAPREIYSKYGCLNEDAAAGKAVGQETFLNLHRCGAH
jgi:hypothetical protein